MEYIQQTNSWYRQCCVPNRWNRWMGSPKGRNSENLPLHTCSNQLVCGSLPHNLRHCCRVVVPRDKVSPGKKQTFPSVCRHPIVSGQFGHLIPVKQLIKRALHPNRSLKMLTVRREGAAPHWWHKGVSAARRYALWTAVTQQSCALWLAGAWQPRVRCIQSPTSRQPREAGVLAQGKGNGKWFAIGR